MLLPQPRCPETARPCLPPSSHTQQKLQACLPHLHHHPSRHPAPHNCCPLLLWPASASTSHHYTCCHVLLPAAATQLQEQSRRRNVRFDRNAGADSRNFDLQEVRLVVAVKMQNSTSAASESPQKNNLVQSLRVHQKTGSVSESPQNVPLAAELCKLKTGTSQTRLLGEKSGSSDLRRIRKFCRSQGGRGGRFCFDCRPKLRQRNPKSVSILGPWCSVGGEKTGWRKITKRSKCFLLKEEPKQRKQKKRTSKKMIVFDHLTTLIRQF